MTARTHKEFAITFVFLSTFWIYSHEVVNLNYYSLLIIMLAIGTKGALFPDVDHTWKNVKEKTLFNRVINIIIHMTGGKHRSWQTHSIDVCLISGIVLWALNYRFFTLGKFNELNYQVNEIILMSFYSGWISHLLSDMLTVGGVYILCLGKKNVKLVPRRIGKLEFKTGDKWELFVYKVTNKINIAMSVFALIYPFVFDPTYASWLLNKL